MRCKKIYTGFWLISIFFCLAIALSSCGSTKGIALGEDSDKEGFVHKKLSNAVPVIFKQNRGSKIVVFRLVFEGGNSVIDKSLSGIENITLDLALRGSEAHPYSEIQQLEYEKSFSFTSSSGKDYSTAGFICIQRDLAEVFSIFADCIINPAFSEAEFEKQMKDISMHIASRKADPSGALGNAISKAAFTNHPYETTASVSEESFPNINLTMVRGLHQSLLNAMRLKIVVVGNFSSDLIDSFTKELENTFGQVARKAYSAPKIPKIPAVGESVRVANEQAGDTGYIAGLYSCPRRTDSDYVPYAIASMYIDDLLFAQVREKAGAVYSINTGVIGGKEMLGVLSVYKASEKKQLKKLINDAILSFNEEEISKKIDQYKNKYMTSIFSSSQISSGLASSIISSLEYHGSENAYLKRGRQIQDVEAKDVIAAYKKYFEPVARNNAVRWIIVDGKDNLSEYDF